MKENWTITREDTNGVIRKAIKKMSEEERAYFDGFKHTNNTFIEENDMFKEEMNDIEIVYENTIENTKKSLDELMPIVMYQIKEFMDLYMKKEAFEEKLNTLRSKLGKDLGDEDE